MILTSPQSKKSIGALVVQLRIKAQNARTPPNVTGSRKMVEDMRSKIADTLGVEYAKNSHSHPSSVNTAPNGCSEQEGFELLDRVRDQLDSMNSGKLKTALGAIDAAAKVYRLLNLNTTISDRKIFDI